MSRPVLDLMENHLAVVYRTGWSSGTKKEAVVENQERNGGGLSKGNASRDEEK